MRDTRLVMVADILVNHSLELRKNDVFIISANPNAAPLVKEVYIKALEAGAHPHIRLGLSGLAEHFYNHASEEQLQFVSPLSKYEIQTVDARLAIISSDNTKSMTNIDPIKQSISSKANEEIHTIFLQRAAKKELRWCVTQYPTNAAAQDAEMSLEEYEEFIFNAANVYKKNPVSHWHKMYTHQEKIKALLEKKTKIQVVADNTDLTFNVKDRKWINCHGKQNFPDGEVFTGPVEKSAQGHISFSFPAVHGGREVTDVCLFFEKGKVVKEQASKGLQFLKTMLDMDNGSRYIGEFAFGTNYGVKKYTKNTLFDEKIGGTIHIAVGSGYPETGSKNKSSLHWDMMCDLRKNGEVYADDELIYKKGKFLSL